MVWLRKTAWVSFGMGRSDWDTRWREDGPLLAAVEARAVASGAITRGSIKATSKAVISTASDV